MTPGARLQAAIELLQAIHGGTAPADRATATYFRTRRYIGGADRRAVLDHVYSVLRRRAALGWKLDRARGDVKLPELERARMIARMAVMEGWSADKIAGAFDGGQYRLQQDDGKITVINFWGSWCGPCKTETPQFAQVYDKYQKRGVMFVGIDVLEDGRDDPKAFVRDAGVHYPNVYDEEGRTALKLGNIRTQGYPFTVILDRQHRVAAVYLERLAALDLEPVLNKLIAEKP